MSYLKRYSCDHKSVQYTAVSLVSNSTYSPKAHIPSREAVQIRRKRLLAEFENFSSHILPILQNLINS